jgi:hypothetical protein
MIPGSLFIGVFAGMPIAAAFGYTEVMPRLGLDDDDLQRFVGPSDPDD